MSLGYNLDSDGSCTLTSTGDLPSQNPLLGPLQDNGGETLTHAPLEGSPAIEAGMTTLKENQRGTFRPQGADDDIGAFELMYSDPEPNLFDVFLPIITRP